MQTTTTITTRIPTSSLPSSQNSHFSHHNSAIVMIVCLILCFISLLFLLIAQTNASPVATPDGSPILTTSSPELPNLDAKLGTLRKITKNLSVSDLTKEHPRDGGGGTMEKIQLERPDNLVNKIDRLAENSKGNVTEITENKNDKRQEVPQSLPQNSSSISIPSDGTRLLCQFFVFGILFGIVCSISACSCLLRPRRHVRHNNSNWSTSRLSGTTLEANIINRLSQIREPFAPDKPYCLKFDERGLYYASPLTREVPALPTYEQACKMTTLADIPGRVASAITIPLNH